MRGLLWLLCASVLATATWAQQFDNFGEDTGLGGALEGDIDLENFDFGTLPETEGVPSLGDEDGLPDGSDIELTITEGQTDTQLFLFPGTGSPVTSVSQPATEQAPRVTLRALDKTLGRPTDVDMAVGETVVFGRIAIRLMDCRYPADDPSSDAYAQLAIYDMEGNSLFEGWMVASSPALSALEHPRYDVWVLRCGAA